MNCTALLSYQTFTLCSFSFYCSISEAFYEFESQNRGLASSEAENDGFAEQTSFQPDPTHLTLAIESLFEIDARLKLDLSSDKVYTHHFVLSFLYLGK